MVDQIVDKKGILVFTGRIARALLDYGYEIIDVMPNRYNKQSTIFVFKEEGDILAIIQQIKNIT